MSDTKNWKFTIDDDGLVRISGPGAFDEKNVDAFKRLWHGELVRRADAYERVRKFVEDPEQLGLSMHLGCWILPNGNRATIRQVVAHLLNNTLPEPKPKVKLPERLGRGEVQDGQGEVYVHGVCFGHNEMRDLCENVLPEDTPGRAEMLEWLNAKPEDRA